MFYFFSQVKVKRVLFAGLVLVLFAALLAGCKTDAEDDTNAPGSLPSGLVGKWVADYGDYFEINRGSGTETFKYYYDSNTLGSEGTIRFVSNYDSSSGVIIVEYTKGATDPNKPFGAVYYLNFTGRTVSLNSAWDATAADYDANTATLAEAIGKFTKGSMGNYIDVSHAATYTGIPGNTNP